MPDNNIIFSLPQYEKLNLNLTFYKYRHSLWYSSAIIKSIFFLISFNSFFFFFHFFFKLNYLR